MIHIVYLLPEWHILARKWEAEILEKVKKFKNYTGLTAPDRYYIGFLGEFVFEYLLKLYGIPYVKFVRTDGVSDRRHEFQIDGKRFDVKTSGGVPWLLFPYKQFHKECCGCWVADFLVGICLEKTHGLYTKAHVCGWIGSPDFIARSEYCGWFEVPDQGMPHRDLYPLDEIWFFKNAGIVLRPEYPAPSIKETSPLAGEDVKRIWEKYSTPKLEKIKKRLLPF